MGLFGTMSQIGGLSPFPVKDVASSMFKPFGFVNYAKDRVEGFAKQSPLKTIVGGGSDGDKKKISPSSILGIGY